MTLEKRLLTYWKNNLADAMRASVDVTPTNSYQPINDPFYAGRIEESITSVLFEKEEIKRNKEKGITRMDSPEWERLERIPILFSPFKVNPIPENLQYMGNSKSLYPFWIPANLLRTGELRVPDEYFPLIPREYLSPIGNEFHDFVLTTVDEIDQAAALKREPIESWPVYAKFIEDIFNQLTEQPLTDYHVDDHLVVKETTVVVPDKEVGAAIAIIDLYKHLLEEENLPPLLHQFITLDNKQPTREPIKAKDFIEGHLQHLGQMGNLFPLSISQRKSLYTYLESSTALVFAVNGPPGTGKTTLLQSIVANEVVLSAIKGEEAPLILACSANNQAVTNINESFIKADSNLTDLKDRWLPDFSGYASYLPANDKSEKELANLNFIKLGKAPSTFSAIETSTYVSRAKDIYLQKGNAYLNKNYLQVKELTDALQREILGIKSSLENGSNLWKKLSEAINSFKVYFVNNTNDNQYYSIQFWNEQRQELESLEAKVKSYFDHEPFLRKLFCFLSFSRWIKERELEVKAIFRNFQLQQKELNYRSRINLLEFLQQKIETVIAIENYLKNWSRWKDENKILHNPPDNEQAMWDVEYTKLKSAKNIGYFFDEVDVSLRHKAFHLAIHYWEGRWLDTMTDQLNRKELNNGLGDKMERWRTRAMLTPCFVSTFYMAPKFFSYSNRVGYNDDKTPKWESPPMTSFIDLLIVDESGQVSPEIGTAIFGLAKKAVIVGDVKQIEPVWNMTPKMDMGNLVRQKIMSNVEETIHKSLSDNGFLSSNGSIMKMAQNACAILDPLNKLKERGMMLVEHRRCYDEIIAYCNDLAYEGMLKPMKGKANSGPLFAPMLLIHSEGGSQVNNKDRSNEVEAEHIKKWLITNKSKIEDHYNHDKSKSRKTIEDVIGIITPFKGQKRLLVNKLKSAGLQVSKMKIGTVHALQGAEREIILFSPVYGEGDVSVMFFDRDNKPNILNVAVSRAKESFIVFGNERIFNPKANTPSGKLIKYLAKDVI
jgi:hypothetical protein